MVAKGICYHCYGKKGGKTQDSIKTLWIKIKTMKYAWRNSMTGSHHTLVPVYVYLQRIDVKQNVVVSVQVDNTTSNVK